MGRERQIIILENGVQVVDSSILERVVLTSLRPVRAFANKSTDLGFVLDQVLTLEDMAIDHRKGKIKGYKVPESDPSVKSQTWEEIKPQLAAYRESRRLRR